MNNMTARKPERIGRQVDLITDLSIRLEKGVSDIAEILSERKKHSKEEIKKMILQTKKDNEVFGEILSELCQEIT